MPDLYNCEWACSNDLTVKSSGMHGNQIECKYVIPLRILRWVWIIGLKGQK